MYELQAKTVKKSKVPALVHKWLSENGRKGGLATKRKTEIKQSTKPKIKPTNVTQ